MWTKVLYVFASSLRSLVSPWARSLDAHYPRSPARWPRPVAPPPPPRRNSDPITSAKDNNQKKHRRYSDIRNPKPEIDLRQELLSLNLNNREVDRWLGNKFTEAEEDAQSVETEVEIDFRFNHDIPLQRSISLDRGIEIFNYLQTLTSESESDSNSTWSLQTEEQNRTIEQYRSFEDIPAPFKVKNRRASLAVHNESYGQSLALFVLKESYKGMDNVDDVNDASPIKKLQKTYSFKNFDDIRELDKNSGENLRDIADGNETKLEITIPSAKILEHNIESENHTSPDNKLRKIFSFTAYSDIQDCDKDTLKSTEEMVGADTFSLKERTCLENIQPRNNKPKCSLKNYGYIKNSFESLEVKANFDNTNSVVPILKTVSFKTSEQENITAKNKSPRQRRIGIVGNSPAQVLLEIEEDSDKKQDQIKGTIKRNVAHCKSCEELICLKKPTIPRFGSAEDVADSTPSTSGVMKRGKEQSISNVRKLKKNFSFRNLADTKRLILPSIVISNVNDTNDPVGERTVIESEHTTNASNVVDSSRTCDCRICTEDEVEDRMSFLRRNLKKLFIKIVSYRDYGKKLAYWDVNNNLDENEMYNSIMHILKLMLGLWLRHFDHN